jgi:hypothetical protein
LKSIDKQCKLEKWSPSTIEGKPGRFYQVVKGTKYLGIEVCLKMKTDHLSQFQLMKNKMEKLANISRRQRMMMSYRAE